MIKYNLPEFKQRVIYGKSTTATIMLIIYGNQYRIRFTLVSNDLANSRLIMYDDSCYYPDRAMTEYYKMVISAILQQRRYELKPG